MITALKRFVANFMPSLGVVNVYGTAILPNTLGQLPYEWQSPNLIPTRKSHAKNTPQKKNAEKSIWTQRYFDMLDACNDLVLIITKNGLVSFANKAFRQAANIAETGMFYWQEVVEDTSLKQFQFLIDCALNNEQPEKATVSFRCRQHGGTIIGLGNAQYHNIGQEDVEIIFFLKDITAKHAISQKLERLTTNEEILNHLPADVCIVDKNGMYKYLNPNAIKNDETRAWLIGKNDYQYFERKGIDTALANVRTNYLKTAVATKKDVSWIDEHTLPDGTKKHILRIYHPIVEGDSSVEYIIGYGIDVNELKQSELALKKSETEKIVLIDGLNYKIEESRQFNYIISHNLRAPLANILGICNLINDEHQGVDATSLPTFTAAIEKSAQKLDGVIRDLTNILAAKNVRNEQFELLSVTKTIKTVIELLNCKGEIPDNSVSIAVDESAEDISTIKSYLNSILHNLISNACKYRCKNRPLRVLITVKEINGYICFKVEDNGIGIDLAKYGSEVFGLYKRFTTAADGTGLGLHMTKAQVHSLGGCIDVTSTLGEGSCFTVYLPNGQQDITP